MGGGDFGLPGSFLRLDFFLGNFLLIFRKEGFLSFLRYFMEFIYRRIGRNFFFFEELRGRCINYLGCVDFLEGGKEKKGSSDFVSLFLLDLAVGIFLVN